MNSKLPPKYTILFLLLFIFNANKGGCAVSLSTPIHSANLQGDLNSIPSLFVISGSGYKSTVRGLESYQWYTGTAKYQG